MQQLLSAPIYREELETHCSHADVKSSLKNQPENMSHANTEDCHGNLEGGRERHLQQLSNYELPLLCTPTCQSDVM